VLNVERDARMKDKFILDVCCGPRHIWFNKKHPNVVYGDIRREKKGFSSYEKSIEVQPDIIMDFRKIPYPDKTFRLVVFDPPHIIGNMMSGALTKKYGILSPITWRKDLNKGFNECWRVLEEYGILIFKWNDCKKSYTEILKIIGKNPLFHSTMGKRKSVTYWACFMKLPEEYNKQERLE